ncbi:autotransporter domain-containing protein [Bradyrhizobium erythrophlei]|uniref:autotransporter domain-containing protein n=1 Tax=Bradyrhizobium erythrophlei TaxID=1437360 RepID=UPI0035EC2BF6
MAALAEVQIGSTFNSEGPGPAVGPRNSVGSGDNPPNGTVTGAVEAIATDPSNSNVIYVGSVGGGIWKTTNAGTSWTPLTDQKLSLSIGSLSLDPTDPTHQTLIAGNGNLSNGGFASNSVFSTPQMFGGVQAGLLYSTDGGASFSRLGATTFRGQSVVDVAARGSTILAATAEPRVMEAAASLYSGGLYRSTDGGTTFTLVGPGNGLPPGPVTSLVGDPAHPNTFYAAVSASSSATLAQTAVYRSTDGGATWSAVFTSADSAGTITAGAQTTIKLTAGPAGTIAVGVVNLSSGVLSGLFYSSNNGGTWTGLTPPNINQGGQAPVNIALAIDPTHSNIIYVSGDNNYGSNGGINALAIARVNASSNTITLMSDDNGTPVNTTNGSTTHPDSRSLIFDASGRLLIGTDGGLYARSNPLTNGGSFSGLNNFSVMELYSASFDANSKRLVVSAQDNGSAYQSAPGNKTYNSIGGGDGINARVNDTTLGTSSALYTTCQFLDCAVRTIVDRNGNITHQANVSFGGLSFSYFSAPLVLNNIDPTRMALSDGNVYVTRDTLSGANGVGASNITLALTTVGSTTDPASALDYGTRNNVNALLVGSGPYNDPAGKLWLSTTSTASSLVNLPAYAGLTPTSVKFDTRSDSRFFIADSQNLYGTTNQGTTFQTLTVNLPANLIRPTSLGFIDSNGVAALLVGGLNNADNAGNPIATADSDSTGNLSGWRRFGSGLPNALVTGLQYNAKADTLTVATAGRGAWLLYDVTSHFASASVLQFGLADNDSTPDAAVLTGNRPLIKYGTGTLTVIGNATYAGGTTIDRGMMVIGNGGARGSIQGNVAFCNNVADPSCDASTNKILAFNRSDAFAFNGTISGPGQLLQAGTGTLTLTGIETYTGATTVGSGMLIVNGSIASSSLTTVNAGAALAGTGTVGNTFVNGGILAPGNPVGTLTVQGNLVFTAAASYLVQITGTNSGKTLVQGTATLGGASLFTAFSGSSIASKYLILNATGGISGSFASVAGTPAGFTASVSYDAQDAYLTYSFAPSTAGLNTNQKNVLGAVTNAFNSGASIPVLFGAIGPAGLTQVSGETATGSQQTTFQAMDQFVGALLDPFIAGRDDGGAPQGGAPAYADERGSASAYAAKDKVRGGAERDAFAAVYKAPLPSTIRDPHWSVWAAGFGGSQTSDGSGGLGSNSATSRIFGTAVGADYLLSPRTVLGFALAGGGTNFSVNNLGTGRSDLFQAGAFVRHAAGQAYIAGALAYGWQDVTTDRIVTVAGVDRLRAEFNANAYSGRIEGGYRFVTPWIGMTPYAAGQFTTFNLPAYVEQVLAGSSAFALAYGAKSVTDTRTELGVRTDRSFAMTDGVLTLRGRLAWAHDFNPDRSIGATFQTLPGASFVVNGAAQASESALTTASAEMKWLNGWSTAATFEGAFSNVTRSYAGKGVVRYQW